MNPRNVSIERVLERFDHTLLWLAEIWDARRLPDARLRKNSLGHLKGKYIQREWDMLGICERTEHYFQKHDVVLVSLTNGAGQRWPVDGFSHRLGRVVLHKYVSFYKWTPGLPRPGSMSVAQERAHWDQPGEQHRNHTSFQLFDLKKPVQYPLDIWKNETDFGLPREESRDPPLAGVRRDVIEALRAAYPALPEGGSDPQALSVLFEPTSESPTARTNVLVNGHNYSLCEHCEGRPRTKNHAHCCGSIACGDCRGTGRSV